MGRRVVRRGRLAVIGVFCAVAALADRTLAAQCLGLLSLAPAAPRLAPISHFHDLVAGAGVPGFENGEFYRAGFHAPLGLAVLEKKRALAVADREDRKSVV